VGRDGKQVAFERPPRVVVRQAREKADECPCTTPADARCNWLSTNDSSRPSYARAAFHASGWPERICSTNSMSGCKVAAQERQLSGVKFERHRSEVTAV
jgi:hypothetical protein